MSRDRFDMSEGYDYGRRRIGGSVFGRISGERSYHRFGGGGGSDQRGRFERGFGGAPGRLFDAGEMKLVILKFLSEQPSYGYQLIKTMEQRLSGGYTPSAGVIYPTLTMLKKKVSSRRRWKITGKSIP